MHLKNLVGLTSLFLFCSSMALASSVADVKSSIIAARDSLLQMLKDPSKRGDEQQKLVISSAEKVTANILELKVAPEKTAKYEEMKKLWNEFTDVRSKEVVPNILSGKIAEAEKLVNGVQKERLMKIIKLCGEL